MAGRYTPKKSETGAGPDAARAAEDAVRKATAGGRTAASAPVGSAGGSSTGAGSSAPRSYGRYTPPTPPPAATKPTPIWVLPVMFASFLLGVLAIILNYVEVLPGAPTNKYLLIGLAFVVLGFLSATQLR